MAFINLDENGRFEPWPIAEWLKVSNRSECTECHQTAALYRVTYDDFLCLNCGKAVTAKWRL